MYTVLTIMNEADYMRLGMKFLIVPLLPALPAFAAAYETAHHYDRIHQGASAQTQIENDTVIIKKGRTWRPFLCCSGCCYCWSEMMITPGVSFADGPKPSSMPITSTLTPAPRTLTLASRTLPALS